MVRAAQLQRFSEEILVQKIIAADNLYIIKQAGLFEQLGFGQIASSIVSFVKQHVVEEDSPAGYLKAFGNVILQGTLFKVSPITWGAYNLIQFMGIDISGILGQVWEAVKSALATGSTLTEDAFDSIVKEAAHTVSITKVAQLFGRNRYRRNPTLIQRIFGDLFSRGRHKKAGWLARGILMWALRTALLGVGLVTATGVVAGFASKFMGASSEEAPEETVEATEHTDELEQELAGNSTQPTKAPPIRLQPASGTKVFKNNHSQGQYWMIPVLSNIEDTLMAWVGDVYPDLFKLAEYDHIEEKIKGSSSFKRVANKLRAAAKSGPRSIIVPEEFTSRKQIIDEFIGEVTKGLL